MSEGSRGRCVFTHLPRDPSLECASEIAMFVWSFSYFAALNFSA